MDYNNIYIIFLFHGKTYSHPEKYIFFCGGNL